MKNLKIFSSGLAVLIFLLAAPANIASAQARITITGTVSDATGPIPGANVVVKGTGRATQTDINGWYTIAATIGETLVFSYVGMSTKEVSVKSQKVINVTLDEALQLNEVVVAGALGIRRRDAVASSQQVRKGQHVNAKITRPGKKLSPKAAADTEAKSRVHIRRDKHIIADALPQEDYEAFIENPFQDPKRTALSTFSIDVDNASYTNIRRFINHGQTVPRDAVRVEEMVNFFKYNYPQPSDNHPFSINTDITECPWNPGHKLLRVGLQGKILPTDGLPASNLVFLIDVSGSMSDENKLPLLKESMKVLQKQLRAEDRVSIVVYAGAAGLVLPPTSGNSPDILAALGSLQSGGSTAGGAGIELAYKIASENFIKNGNNRVVLATDGDFNVGSTSPESMEKLIEDKRKSGVFLTVLGFGMGNYKDDRLELLADKGNGNYAYIDNIQEANRFLGREFKGSMFAIAKDVKIQIEFNPKQVKSYRLIGYENRLLKDEDFANDAIDAGELGSGHTVTALYEIIPHGVKSELLEEKPKLKYTDTQPTGASALPELATIKFRYKKPDGNKSTELLHIIQNRSIPLEMAPEDMRFGAAVAWFGLKLRDSRLVKDKSANKIKSLAQGGLSNDDDGYRAEFIRLVEAVQ